MKIYRNKFLSWASVIVVAFAIIFSGWALWIFAKFYDLAGDKINLDATSKIGDFIGGILGPILSFAGVLLFYLALRYQREDLKIQSDELKATREEFQVNRLTNIIFLEINKFDKLFEQLHFGHTLQGYENEFIYRMLKFVHEDGSLYAMAQGITKENIEQDVILNIKCLDEYSSELNGFVYTLNNICIAVQKSLCHSELRNGELEIIKDLFIDNVGEKIFQFLELFQLTHRNYSGLSEVLKYMNHVENKETLSQISVYAHNILMFKHSSIAKLRTHSTSYL